MASNSTGPGILSAEGHTVLNEGIGLILSRWTAMRAAVENGWGGRDSQRKAEGTNPRIFYFFTQSRDPLDSDRLKHILEGGLLELNTVADDGSIEEVRGKLIGLYEACLEGNYHKIIEDLRRSTSQMAARATVVKVGNDDEEDEESDDEDEESDDEDEEMGMGDNEPSDMMVDAPVHRSMEAQVGPSKAPEAEDGWTVVQSRRNKGKGN